jgi:putative ABC transport system permease protein
MEPLLQLLVLLVLLITLVVMGMAIANRIIFKMAFRNFSRRKAQSAIVISGLMVGTAIISSSLVVGDTMRYLFEVQTYRSLGEVDEQVYGMSQFGGVQYFSEEVYTSVAVNLSGVDGIEAIAPLIMESCSVQNTRNGLVEPSIRMTGYNSTIMRSNVFKDLDGAGFYPDKLGSGQTAINAWLGDALEARTGDVLTFSYGVKNSTVPGKTDAQKRNFTIAVLFKDKELWGKANFGQAKTAFFELDFVQNLLNRQGEINNIFISNKGDAVQGEYVTGKVNDTIRTALDGAVGMRDLGLSFSLNDGVLEMTSDRGYFIAKYSDLLLKKGADAGAKSLTGAMVPVISINATPTGGLVAIGFNSTDTSIPALNEGSVYVFFNHALRFNISNGTLIPMVTIGMDGLPKTNLLTAVILPSFMEAALPEELRNISVGFVGPDTAQSMLAGGLYPVKVLTFAQLYGATNETLLTIQNEVTMALDGQISADDAGLKLYDEKFDSLKSSRAGGSSIGDIFLVFSTFSIIAGVVLIVNIFIMLGEERKSEMGMARAVGMKRKHLVRMFLFEGTIYVFIASAVGSLVGLALGRLLIVAFGFIFQSANGGDFPFHFTWESILTAFCMGVLLTFITMYFASRRASRLNIIRAIRKIPEPRGARAMRSDLILGMVTMTFGILFTFHAYAQTVAWAWLAGPTLVFLGLGAIAYKWVSLRAALTPACIAVIFWIFNPFEIPIVAEATDQNTLGLDMFIVSGLCLVLASVLLVMFNSDVLLAGLQRTVGKGKATRAVLKTAISYPMYSKLKTGMTLGMFALIIFTVTVIAMIASMQASTKDNVLSEQCGGYDIIGFSNSRTPFDNLSKDNVPDTLKGMDIRQLETVSTAIIKLDGYDKRGGTAATTYGPALTTVSAIGLLGISDEFLKNNVFSLQFRDRNYTSDRDAWLALGTNRSLCIIDGTRFESATGISFGDPAIAPGAFVGGTVSISDLQGQNRTRTFRIIGIMDQMYFLNGIFVSKALVKTEYGGVDSTILVQLGPDVNTQKATKLFKKAFIDYGLQAIDFAATIDMVMTISTNVMYLMEGFLAIGLMVGIAGIGIISYRNVIERRQQIGMMRAIGFKKKDITKSFLIEISFITILSTVIGLLLGIGVGHQIYLGGFEDIGASFIIPWGNLLLVSILAYIATLIFTFYPARQASKVPPAEALRYIE